MMPTSLSVRSMALEKLHTPLVLSTKSLSSPNPPHDENDSTYNHKRLVNTREEREGRTSKNKMNEGDGGCEKDEGCKWESLETRFDRLVLATREARKNATDMIRVSKVLGPVKVCSHLVDSVNENDGGADDDIALILSIAGTLRVLHGVSLLLVARRRGSAGVIKVGTMTGLRDEDIEKHYALLVLAAQVTSNATVPSAFLAYVWGREGDAFLPLYVRLAAQPFVTPGLKRRASRCPPVSASSWSSSLMMPSSVSVPHSAPPSIVPNLARVASVNSNRNMTGKAQGEEVSSSSSSSIAVASSGSHRGKQNVSQRQKAVDRKKDLQIDSQGLTLDQGVGSLCVSFKQSVRLRNHYALRQHDLKDGRGGGVRGTVVNPRRTGEAPPIYVDDVVVQRKLSDLLTHPLSTCLSLASSSVASNSTTPTTTPTIATTATSTSGSSGASALSSSLSRRARWLAAPGFTTSNQHHHYQHQQHQQHAHPHPHYHHHHGREGPASLGTPRPFVRDRHTRVIATFDLLNDDLLVDDSHRLHHSRRSAHGNVTTPPSSLSSPQAEATAAAAVEKSDATTEHSVGEKRRDNPRFRRDSWLEPKSN